MGICTRLETDLYPQLLALRASTVNWYFLPGVRLVKVHESFLALVMHRSPVGFKVTRYPVTLALVALTGLVHEMTADVPLACVLNRRGC